MYLCLRVFHPTPEKACKDLGCRQAECRENHIEEGAPREALHALGFRVEGGFRV